MVRDLRRNFPQVVVWRHALLDPKGFCGAGGASEGARRCGIDSVGVDIVDQPDYRRRYGDDHFVEGDAVRKSCLAAVCKRWHPLGGMYSPPCQFYSRLRTRGGARHPALIEQTRDLAEELCEFYSIENVMGASRHLPGAIELDGPLFGLKVFRSRLFETNFPIHLDECVSLPARALRARCCLGRRRRWRLLDEFGRPTAACCCGNMFAPLGKQPVGCSACECAEAMGVDPGHMSYERLAQSIPPDYAQLISSQMCMHAAGIKFGVPKVTFDESRRRPQWARATLARWLRGAGDDRLPAGLSIEVGVGGVDAPSASTSDPAPVSTRTRCVQSSDLERRELFYSHAGGYSCCWSQASSELASSSFNECVPLNTLPSSSDFSRANVYLEGDWTAIGHVVRLVADAPVGSRVTVVTEDSSWPQLVAAGFERLDCVPVYGGGDSLRARGLLAACWGRRISHPGGSSLVHSDVEWAMDEADRLGLKADPMEKAILSQSYLPWEPERWMGKGLDSETERIMTEGVRVDANRAARSFEVPQYAFPSAEAMARAIHEADRALAAGHMSYVPDAHIDMVLDEGIVHPWLVVQQGDKWRLCQDYSGGTNKLAHTAPFGLPCVWDAVKGLKPSSFMAKYDLRDGFWGVPVQWESRRFLVMRHPSSGRLMWCDRLPFGFLDSPRKFCHVSEAVAQLFRKRMAGMGVYIFCYCDDYLIIGDDESCTKAGCAEFERLCAELGLQWAPHKHRGPCRCLEFLGLLIVNVPDLQCVGLTASRQKKVSTMVDEWLAIRPPDQSSSTSARPVELARLLGHLVFASQCVPGGRTYMQGMLSQFKGLEVDWRHGLVRTSRHEQWHEVDLSPSFFRDLAWWQDHLSSRNCVIVGTVGQHAAAAVIAGTDSSDWGSGQLVWLDGEREESRLKFTAVEKRRPINWRELLGILRVVEMSGPRASGCTLLVETDNTASRDASHSMYSKAADMQELLRRLLDVVERWNITLRVLHTPGKVLFRPDQTSRGDPIREPRLRLRSSVFSIVSCLLGGFSEWMGAERRHSVSSACPPDEVSIWLHPSFDSVGSALRCLGQRLEADNGSSMRGAIVVPHDESAVWWRLTRHFIPIGRWESGSAHLEMCQLGRWSNIASQRAAIVLSFPRTAGAFARPVISSSPASSGYSRVAGGHERALALLEGSYVYQPSIVGRGRGVLYRVWVAFDPTSADSLVLGEGGNVYVLCAELLESTKRRGEFCLAPSQHRDNSTDGGSFAPTGRLRPWEIRALDVWTVNHLVRTRDGKRRERRNSEKCHASAAAELIYEFDATAAEREIAGAMALGPSEVATSVSAPPPAAPCTPIRDDRLDFAPMYRILPASPSSGEGSQDTPCVAELRGTLAHVQEMRSSLVSAPLSKGGVERVHAGSHSTTGASTGFDPGIETCSDDTAGLRCSLAELDLDDTSADAGPVLADAGAELRASLAAAAEAVVLRVRRAATQPTSERQQKATELHGQFAKLRCRYSAQRCEGCDKSLPFMSEVSIGVRALVHPNARCHALAVEAAAKQKADRKASGTKAGTGDAPDLSLRQSQFSTKLSERTLRCAAECLADRCDEQTEQRLFCMRGCGRGVHLVTCLGTSALYRAAGRLVCSECRLGEMLTDGDSDSAPAELRRQVTISMVAEVTSGAVSTAAGRSQFDTLELQWLAQSGSSSVARLRLPRDNVESFYSFTWWLARDAGRARSFATVMRAAGAVMTMTERTDFTKQPRIKAAIKEILKVCHVEQVPCTPTTRLIVRQALDVTIPRACSGMRDPKARAFMIRRSRMLIVAELGCGARVGEATGSGGSNHGLAAVDSCIQRPAAGVGDGLGETVELCIRDSKTGPGRHAACLGTTRGPLALEAARYTREYWEACDLKIETVREAGMIIERPDYYVVRVAGNGDLLRKVASAAPTSSCAAVRSYAKTIATYATRRANAQNKSEADRYVNVTGGSRGCAALREAISWLESLGFGRESSIVPGPLIRATNGFTITHEALEAGSTYTHLAKPVGEAHELIKTEGIIDPEFDLQGQVEPTWGNHSLRRHADGVAQQAKREGKLTEISTQLIDYFFGWCLKEMAHNMQIHYAGLDRPARRLLAQVTMWL